MTHDIRPPLQVMRHAFAGVAEEMGVTLQRSAFSVVIKDLNDYSCAVFDSEGALVAQGNNMPTHLGSMGHALRALIALWEGDVHAGDAFISNDPYAGGQHAPDVHVFMPVFVGDRLIAWAGSIAHHADWGGRVPGSMSVDNASKYEEGVIYPHVRLEHRGAPCRDVYRLIASNIRQPEVGLGDLRAQVAAGRIAVRRIEELAARWSVGAITGSMAELIDHSERLTRLAIEDIADGVFTAEGFLDGDGHPGTPPVRIAVAVTVAGSQIIVDLSETDPQQITAINVPSATTRSAVLYALRTILDDDVPHTEGCSRALTIVTVPGSLVDPLEPAPVSDRHLTSQRLADVLVRAFAQMNPERATAGWFVGAAWMACFPTSPRTGVPSMLLLNLVGGGGACATHAGPDGADAHMANATLIPAEVVEENYPLRVERYALVDDSGGTGQHRGGRGVEAAFTNVSAAPFDIQVGMEQTDPRHAPWGAAGGYDGAVGRVAIQPDGGDAVTVAPRESHTLDPAATLILTTGGGGGYGVASGIGGNQTHDAGTPADSTRRAR